MEELDNITKLHNIFLEKDWLKNPFNETVFGNFCILLSNLSETQRRLILELTTRYTWLNHNDCQTRLIKALQSVEDEKLVALDRIYVFPIMKKDDEDKTKSGHYILYMLRGLQPFLSKFRHIKFIEIESFEKLAAGNFKIGKKETIFLVDDYLGSGETITETIEIILKNRDIDISNLNIIAVAAQKETVEFVKDLGIPIYTEFVYFKGISDYYKSPDLEEKSQIMLDIESLIPGNFYSFGYNGSEALISLVRTPDNTFPIFWKQYRISRRKFDPPFPRYSDQ